MAAAEPEDVLPYIRSVTYPNQKSRALVASARGIVERFGGAVPATREELRTLPGVGPKSANVIVAVAFEQPAIAVDTHVFRVANRIGLVKDARTPGAVEAGLRRVVPTGSWIDAHHLLILHGRYTCLARRPACERCPLAEPPPGSGRPLCDFFVALQRLPPPIAGLDPNRGRYYARPSKRYFDEPTFRVDRSGVEQIADPRTGSTDVYETRTGKSTRRVKDYRVGRR
jgi:endonuclease-3